ncbi:MAG: STAS domain-containing protein [Acidovorax sp.]|uniref:STAS domain-containing protein n=1 Tax=Acidovorax sp. TaxID=1872122 RepID=UPI0026391DD3|nr:STAS domain-containing protein [Acidovorax sp.]MDH4428583.1 STAS domain-containing protein [Acidovorax sp.]
MLVVPPELTHRQATACLAMLLQGLKAHREPTVVVDATALKAFDSSALAVLLECRREALSSGKSFSVQGLPAALRGMAGLYGVGILMTPAG